MAKQWSPDAELSQCDRLQVQVGVTNHGGLSAKGVQLVSHLPKEWQIEGLPTKGQNIEQGKIRQIVLTYARLWPQHEWIEHYQILSPLHDHKGADKRGTQVHEVSARSKGGFTAPAVTNKVSWHAPHISVHVEAPGLRHAGESILQQIRVHNEGDWPIHQLTLIGQLPPAVHSITATGAVITDNIVTWQFDKLPPGAEQSVQLAFTPEENRDIPRLETHFIAYDQAYGEETTNDCVKGKAQTATQVTSLQSPQLKSLTFQVKGMGTQALLAIANNLSSSFDVTELHFRAQTLHELVSSQAAESTIIYQ